MDTQAGSLDASVDWNDVDGATSYLVRWRPVGTGDPLNAGVDVQSSDASITVGGYGDWVVRVEACNSAGCGRPVAERFEVAASESNPEPTPEPKPTPQPTPTPVDRIPAQPTGVEISTEAGSLDASVDWGDVDGATGYLVRWRPAGAGNPLNAGVEVQSSDASITVAAYGDWVVRVEACNSAGCGRHVAQRFNVAASESNPGPTPEPTPQPTPVPVDTVPAQPAGMEVSPEAGSLDVSVDWDDVDGATGYLVRWRSVSNGGKLNAGVEVQSSSASITVDDYGDWVVRVEACNSAGCGSPTASRFEVSSATSPASPGFTLTVSPDSLAEDAGQTQVTVTAAWDGGATLPESQYHSPQPVGHGGESRGLRSIGCRRGDSRGRRQRFIHPCHHSRR